MSDDSTEHLSEIDERLVASRLDAAGLHYQREPSFIVHGKKPDFLIETPNPVWLEVKSLGDSFEWDSVLKRYDAFRSIAQKLPATLHATFGVTERTSSEQVSILSQEFDRISDKLIARERVIYVLNGAKPTLSWLSARIACKESLVLSNCLPDGCPLPFVVEGDFPYGPITVFAPDGQQLERLGVDVFSAGIIDTFAVVTRVAEPHSGWHMGYADGAVKSKIVDRLHDHLTDANRKVRNAQTYVSAPGVVVATVRSRSDFTQLRWACKGRPMVGFEPGHSKQYFLGSTDAFFQRLRNRAIGHVLGFDRGMGLRVIANEYSEQSLDRQSVARLVRALRHQPIATPKIS